MHPHRTLWKSQLSPGLLLLCAASACRPATQVTFDIVTDVPCDVLQGTSITVGVEGETEHSDPVLVTRACRPDGTVGAVGSYAVAPKRVGEKFSVSAKIAAAIGNGTNVEDDCKFAKGYADCVVARRRISFVASRSLTVPIELYLICKDVRCDENSTCNKAGLCVSSAVDLSQCDDAGICPRLVTDPDGGLPCFNTSGAEGLFCDGDDAWCNLSPTGARSCNSTPGDSGVSFQCRDSSDCGPNLKCVTGANGVLGRCTPNPQPGADTLCTIGEVDSPCEGGPRQCFRDAGYGLTVCEPVVHPPAGALHCPREASLQCFGTTPYCSQYQQDPRCVSDGGAQCWYNSDCPTGQRCYAGVGGRFSNLCTDTPTPTNNVPLCDPTKGDTDCPNGTWCEGEFYGNTACVRKCWPGLTSAECYGNGHDGVLTIPANTFREINTYTPLAQTAPIGSTTITASTALIDAGTLVLFWQTIGVPLPPSEGNSNSFNLEDGGVGLYEAARVARILGPNTFTIDRPLKHPYTGAAQVVTVPEYQSLTIGEDAGVGFQGYFRGGSWNGTTGGVVAFLSMGPVVNNGTIAMFSSGFLGGNNVVSFPGVMGCTGLDGDTNNNGGAPKGNTLAGLTVAQGAGMGRVLHGGGGGNCMNSGGGGGAHAGVGGRGGKSEDGARDVGGWGGGPLSYGPDRLVLGGGGGAGHGHRNGTSAGGTGGGVVLFAAESVSGNGIIDARGSESALVPDGVNKWGSYVDGIGGGGGGGLVDIRTQSAISCRGIQATGGRGLACSAPSGASGGGGGGGLVRLIVGNHLYSAAACPADVSGGTSVPNGGNIATFNGQAGGEGRVQVR